MHEAIDTLMHEHRVIEQVLASLETFVVDNVRKEASGDRDTVRKYAEFFKNFADKCHHGKEEDRLFTKMNEFGFPRDFGPIAVMLSDHAEGREHVAALASIGAGNGPLGASERDELCEHAMAYIAMLRAHIQKEDNILYPMALRAIPPAEMDALGNSFEAFEREVMGAGEHERFHALAQELIAAYPPDAHRMAEGQACVGCMGHV
jgi:hemerythrin-like domain-containing protein